MSEKLGRLAQINICIASGLAGAVIGSGIVALASEQMNQDEICAAAPSPESFAAVDRALADDSDPALRFWPHKRAGPYAEARRELQKELGLTWHDFDPAESTDSETTFKTLQSFAVQYGISVEVEAQDPEHTPTLAERTAPEAIESMNLLGHNLSALPEEYIRSSGTTNVIFYAEPKTGVAAYADSHGDSSSIHVNFLIPAEVWAHETAHSKDARDCGENGIYNDPEFEALNGDDFEYVDDEGKNPTPDSRSNEGYEELEARAAHDLDWDEYNGNPDEMECAAMDKIPVKAEDVTTVSRYGMETVAEDKADIWARFLNPKLHSVIFDKNKPRLYQKARLLAAREIERSEQSQRTTEYLLRTGSRANVC